MISILILILFFFLTKPQGVAANGEKSPMWLQGCRFGTPFVEFICQDQHRESL